jgi:hypothetical protein
MNYKTTVNEHCSNPPVESFALDAISENGIMTYDEPAHFDTGPVHRPSTLNLTGHVFRPIPLKPFTVVSTYQSEHQAIGGGVTDSPSMYAGGARINGLLPQLNDVVNDMTATDDVECGRARKPHYIRNLLHQKAATSAPTTDGQCDVKPVRNIYRATSPHRGSIISVSRGNVVRPLPLRIVPY